MFEITITVATELQAKLVQDLLETDYAQDLMANSAYELEITEVGGNVDKADAYTPANAVIENDVLDEWAERMLKVVHMIDTEIGGGIDGLGSTDGVYVDAGLAMKILQKFDYLGYQVGTLGLDPGSPMIARDHDKHPCRGYARGLLVCFDDEFPGERQLSWYDESKF